MDGFWGIVATLLVAMVLTAICLAFAVFFLVPLFCGGA